MGRNTPILQEITDVLFTDLDEQATALQKLDTHFRDRLLANVGDINTVATYATQLRLNITPEECAVVLDHMAAQRVAAITLDETEDAINALFEDRFIEP